MSEVVNEKPNLHYTRGITPKRVTDHLRDLGPGQHSPEETSQRQARGTVSDSTGPGIKPPTFCADIGVFNHCANLPVKITSY